MNCGNTFQISLYLKNRIINRASYTGAQWECYGTEKGFAFLCKAYRFSHFINQPHEFLCNVGDGNIVVYLFRNLFLKRYAECFAQWQTHLAALMRAKRSSETPAFPCGNKSIPTARIDRQMRKLRRTPGSYPVNQNGKIPDLAKDHGTHAVTNAEDSQDWRSDLIHDPFDLRFDLCNLGVQFADQFESMSQFQEFRGYAGANGGSCGIPYFNRCISMVTTFRMVTSQETDYLSWERS